MVSVQDDTRGTHQNRPFRVPQYVIEAVNNHIDSFPTMESHYCWADSQRKYFEEGLNIRKMYKMYMEDIGSKKEEYYVSESFYRKLLNTKGSDGFFHPKKDKYVF